MSLNNALKMVNVAKFILCVFYHNKKNTLKRKFLQALPPLQQQILNNESLENL